MFELRPYQQNALTQIRTEYAKKNKKVLLHLATGAGKTVIFCQILKSAHQKGKKAIMVVRGRKLVDQASKRLDREGVPHGVLMAGHKKYNLNADIQICSIDTLISRDLRPKADIIVIDECHLATSAGYKEFLFAYPEAYILGVTATPYTEKSLRHIADVIVQPITTKELIEQGHLVPAKYFCPTLPNLKGVKTTNTSEGRDYNTSDLEHVMLESTIVGDIGTNWLKIAKGRKTLAFCVSVNHSKKLAEYLNSIGIKALHVDANSSDDERNQAIERLESGELDVITNCGILCTGVDIPTVSCIILARPTKSLNLHIQQMGRGTRKAAGKNDFIVLDHAGNVLRHGFITDEHDPSLDEEKVRVKKDRSPRQCTVCFAVFSESGPCPYCGNQNETATKSFAIVDGDLKELTPEQLDPVRQAMVELKKTQKDRGYKRGWVYYQLKERFGQETADKYMPKRFVPSWVQRKA